MKTKTEINTIKKTGLVGQLVVVILFKDMRKIAAKLIAEDEVNIMLENSTGMRSIIRKNQILKIRRPLKYYRTLVDCEDPDENATNTAEIIQ